MTRHEIRLCLDFNSYVTITVEEEDKEIAKQRALVHVAKILEGIVDPEHLFMAAKIHVNGTDEDVLIRKSSIDTVHVDSVRSHYEDNVVSIAKGTTTATTGPGVDAEA